MSWFNVVLILLFFLKNIEAKNLSCIKTHQRADCQSLGIQQLPNDIHNETRILDLHNNQISQLYQQYFNNLPLLKIIFLDNNNLTQIDANVFIDLIHLKYLYLNNNSISEISINSSSLYILSLANNYLKKFEFYLPNLQILILSNCNINFISNEAFKNTPHLVKINLTSNNLKHIGIKLFSHLKKIEQIDLRDNPIINWIFVPYALPHQNSYVLGKIYHVQSQICEKSIYVVDNSCRCWKSEVACNINFTKINLNSILANCISCEKMNKSLDIRKTTTFINEICLASAVIFLGLVVFIIIRELKKRQNLDIF